MVPDPPAAAEAATVDPKDEYLVGLGQAAHVAALVSGDPHLTDLKNLDPPVLAPAAFLHQLPESPDTTS